MIAQASGRVCVPFVVSESETERLDREAVSRAKSISDAMRAASRRGSPPKNDNSNRPPAESDLVARSIARRPMASGIVRRNFSPA